MFLPNGLLTTEDVKHDVEVNPHIIAPDPAASDDCFDVFPPPDLFLLTTTEELKMNAGDDESSSGLNGRLRPRKSNIPSPKTKSRTKSEGRIALDKPKRTSNPSRASQNKQDDLPKKSDFTPTPYFLCPYCDKKFASKQTLTKHIQRMHYSKPDTFLRCLFCTQSEADSGIIQHMVDNHPNQYFACLDCHTRFLTTSELAEHKLNACEKLKVSYRTKLRQKEPCNSKKSKKSLHIDKKDGFLQDGKDFEEGHGFNGIVISCELKPSEDQDGADIEDNITTNLILPPNKNLGNNAMIKKNAVIVLDELQWNKKIPSNFSFHNTDADQILSRLGVVHRSPRTGESTKKDWFKTIDDTKFEKCFDTKFYSKVASNVQENLAKFLDGTCNFNPDPDSTIKTRKSKNNVVINTAEGFPILLACEQYSRNVNDGYMPRAIAPKHKWKWDSPESDKGPLNPDQIKRDSHTNNCIITLVSSLDIWTQLSMRRKFDNMFNKAPIEKKTEKKNIISQELKEILESREIPMSPLQIVKHTNKPATITSAPEFPACLGLAPAAPTYQMQSAVLSGEWVRPRCYVCCACGEQTSESKGLSSHIATQHPNANVQYYEIVGEPLLNADILKHLYVPPSQVCNRTRPPRGFRECTKCQKSVTLEDLHQHMLDCAGDTPAVRRRQCRYRPFGVRRRRPRMPDNSIRKKMRKDIRSQQRRQKAHMRPRPRTRTEVGDAETIRKMLADLPAKRHRVVVNPVNMIQRPRRMLDTARPKMILKKNSQAAQNIKKCGGNKRILSVRKAKSVNSENVNQNSNFDDDEDNKPLRPKLKSIINKTRERETIKRQSVVNRAKRKSIRVEQRKVVDNTDTVAEGSTNVGMEKASLVEGPQRIDVKRGSYNTREHGNRSASGNRDGQRPGCSGTNGNANNSCAPTQNVPLKHSIARLTANSETHDKSVQFHHLFLVQQECNNTNQHVPSGQHTLFENEAVVTRLDKPPLNFCQKSLLDLNALQRSKLNKPRKGLNDCIAMLKNKLVDPLPHDIPGHVSVQCGNDDPIDPDPRPLIQTSIHRDAAVNVNLQSNASHSKPIPRTSVEYHSGQEKMQLQSACGEESLPKLNQKEVVVKRKSPRGKPYDNEMMPPKMIPPCTDLNISPQKHAATHYEKSPAKTRSRSDTRRSSYDSKQHVLVQPNDLNNLQPADIQVSRKKSSTVVYKTKTNWRKATEVPKHLNIYPENVILQNQSEIRQEISTLDMTQDARHDNIQEVRHANVQEVRHDNIPEVRHDNVQGVKHDNRQEMRHENIKVIREEIVQEIGLTPQPSLDIFSGNNMLDIPANIPPAHASTNVESIISTPLDLSSKVLIPGNSKGFLSQDAAYVNYDTCETLDLSNKTFDSNSAFDESVGDDVIVDLSVKPPQDMTLQLGTLDLCVKSNKTNNLPDVFTNLLITDNYPTDLSLKSKETGMLDLTDKRSIDAPIVQDLSASKTFFMDGVPKNLFSNKEKIRPPGLSEEIITRMSPRVVSGTKGNFVGSDDLTDTAIKNIGTTPDLSTKLTLTQDDILMKSSPKSSQRAVAARQDGVQLKTTPKLTRKVNAPQQEAMQPNTLLNLTQNLSAMPHAGGQQKSSPHLTKTRKESAPQQNVVQSKATQILTQNVSTMSHDGVQQKSAPHFTQTLKVCAPQQDTEHVKVPLNLIHNISVIPQHGEQRKSEQHLTQQVMAKQQDDEHLKSSTHLATKISVMQQDAVQLNCAPHLAPKVSTMPKDHERVNSSSHLIPKSSAVKQDGVQLDSTSHLTQKVSATEEDDAQPKSVAQVTLKAGGTKQDNVSIHHLSNLIHKKNATKKDDVQLESTQLIKQKEYCDKRDKVQKSTPNAAQIVSDVHQNDVQQKPMAMAYVIQKECETKQDRVNPAIINATEQITSQDKSTCEISANMQKPVYDPTLKIPQYKIRSKESVSEGLIGDSADTITLTDKTVVSPNISQSSLGPPYSNTSIKPHDNLSYIYGNSTLINSCTISGVVPIHAFSNRAMTASMSRMESTTPVYTLANACITVTKIESSGSATLTNTLLSIPGSTIASTTPVYTLTGTTIGTPTKFSTIHENEFHNTSSVSYSGTQSDPNKADNESGVLKPNTEVQNEVTNNPLSNVEEDPETARKIAMLPKELVDILGNMPVDHRNQLLNVLPQYVSTTVASSSSYDTARTLLEVTTPPLTSTELPSRDKEVVVNDKTPAISAHLNVLGTLNVSSAPSTLDLTTAQLPSSNVMDVKNSTSLNLPLSEKTQNVSKDISTAPVQNTQISKEEAVSEATEKHKESSSDVVTTRDTIPEYAKSQDRIIDLTGDEILPVATSGDTLPVSKITDTAPTITYPQQETPACQKLEVQKNKRNNDKTASLRAVRIKAPAERQKENQMLKRASLEQTSSQPVLNSNDNDLNNLFEANKYMQQQFAIQQAEISSTQHNSKNFVNLMMTVENLPAKLTPCPKDTNTNSGNSAANPNIATEKHTSAPDPTVNPSIKPGFVTSSIPHNLKSNLLNKNTDNTDSKVLENTKSAIDAPKILVPDNEPAFPTEKSILPDDLEPKTNNEDSGKQDVIAKEKAGVAEEDDSDDDIILAAIAKQKKNEKISSVKKQVSAKKKRKEKKLKNLSQTDNVNKNNKAKEESSFETDAGDPTDNVIKLDSPQLGEDENLNFTTFENNNSRISEKSNVEIDVPEINKEEECNKSMDINTDNNEEKNIIVNTIKQQVDEESSKENQTMKSLEQDKQNTLLSEVDSNHLSAEGTENINTDMQKDNHIEIEVSPLVKEQEGCVLNKSKHLKIEKTKTKVKSRQKRKQCEVLTSFSEKNTVMNQDESLSKESNTKDQDYIKDDKAEDKDININSQTSEDLKDVKEEVQSYIDQKKTETLHTVGIIKLDCNNKSTDKNQVFININKNIVGNDSPNATEIDVNLSVPLRRSRRGKSLFVDSNVNDQMISNTESMDYRGPLTKKQLIFSKLLQDEENHTKILNQSPVKDDTSMKVNDLDTRDVASSGSATTVKDICADEFVAEQTKPLKRKKSPQSKRKCKKKKSLKMPVCYNNDNSQSHTRSEVVNSAETLNLTVTDQESVIEKIQGESSDLPKEEQSVAISTEIVEDLCHPIESVKTTIPTIEKAEDVHDDDDNSNNKLPTSIEKRKITYVTNNVECGQSSKPKKAKFNKHIETIVLSDPQDNLDMNTSKATISQAESGSCFTSETRAITCYNLPVAARRTRSKSVVVKSSGAQFYDPYDIDMDDMIENSELPNKSELKTKETKLKSRHSSKTSKCELKTSGIIIDPVAIGDNTGTSEKNKKKTKKTKQDTFVKDFTESLEVKSAVKKSSAKPTYQHSKDHVDAKIKHDFSDSDESSKSDVPLKKYVDEKFKKKTDADHIDKAAGKDISVDRNKRNKDKQNKKNKRSLVLSNNDKDVDVSNEIEEQLRSEQFMESFGFFSERKPRKSNLLASKKISETFHIIANDSDDMYYTIKERTNKKTHTDNKKSIVGDSYLHTPHKKNLKRGQKKEEKIPMKPIPRYCSVCKKEFKRPDNYVRHQMSLMHISRLSEIELQGGVIPENEEPSYVLARRKKMRRHKGSNKKKQNNNTSKQLPLPSLDDIVQEVNKTVRQQQIAGRGLSRDEALFLDCCELLKESHNPDIQNKIIFSESDPIFSKLNDFAITACCHRITYTPRSPIPDLDFLDKIDKSDSKSDGDVDSITAKTILESEEVRNLENDLISGLKEAASKNKALCTIVEPHEICLPNFSSSGYVEPLEQKEKNEDPVEPIEQDANKIKKYPEVKEKMYPDIEEIDMFEDKFDKIKRKCRSQAAAAKQAQAVMKPATGHKQKKSEKKKGKKISKKNYQNTVLTKGALKGFDGIKVSIPTSDINMSAIVPPQENSSKKRKKSTSKKKREKKYSETSSRYDSDHRFKDGSSQKKIDVYEFMDNEDAELFEFRPSTLMERFKSINNKETSSTSKEKHQSRADEREHSCGSVSDGDDFVYMSDDYVCSEDETENSILSCELGNGKTDVKKTSLLKRKDVIEKNAVMGKIFKHNALRSERKIIKPKETAKPKANLDQLFDSLLEDEPNSSMLNNDSPKQEEFQSEQDALSKYDSPNKDVSKAGKKISSLSPDRFSTPIASLNTKKVESEYKASTSKYDINRYPSTSKIELCDIYGPSTSKMPDEVIIKEYKMKKRHDSSSSRNRDTSPRYNSCSVDDHEISEREKSSVRKFEESYDYSAEFQDDAGVARQRARRKCTVGKQNVLAETWSSESEPDGAPPRPNSAESAVAGASRKKKGKKRESQQSFGRRGKVPFKKQEIESRVSFGSRHTSGNTRVGSGGHGSSGRCSPAVAGPSGLSHGGGGGSGPMPALHAPGPRVRPRPAAYYWSSEGDDEQEHLQQHGWIVGDSHKKLVTMLAHAKGRKRSNDDKRHIIE